jgi:hypothetical protein
MTDQAHARRAPRFALMLVVLAAAALPCRLFAQGSGDHIPNAGYLLVANSYGQPNWYLSFSVFGVPGFVSKP